MQKLFTIIGLAFLLTACSQFSNAPTSVAWHNSNARFNSLIIARENMKVAEATIFEGHADVYSQVIPILIPIDTSANTLNSKPSATSFLTTTNPNNPFASANTLPANMNNTANNSMNTPVNNTLNNGMNPTNSTANSQNNPANQSITPLDVKGNLNEVVKKTSLIAERHSNSKYLDEAYFLLGKARLYKGDFLNSIEIFKYINTKGKKADQKHAALIWLMRAYIEEKEYDTALKVAETIRLLELSKENTIDFYLTKAYLHQLRNEYNISVAIAEEVLKVMKKGDEMARVHFAVGQMYDALEQPTLAMPHYIAVSKLHPNYDLDFYARMNLLLDKSSADRGNLDNEFKKMLADRKNKDLKDKIYFTMGNIEERKGNYPKAIEYYQLSVRKATGPNSAVQQAYSFLQLAELNYDKLTNYQRASAYYDSCLMVLPKSSTDFERIYKKANSLNNFVKYSTIIKTEDSLQHLATLNPVALDKLLDKVIQDKKEEEAKKLELAKKIAAQQNTSTGDNIFDGENEKRWDLYEPIAIAKGKTDFVMKWGNRANEDNWRRKDKEIGSISVAVEKGIIDPNAPKSNIRTVKKGEEVPLSKEEIAMQTTAQKKEMMDKIPNTPEKLAESNRRLEDAYYQLGNIYKFQFNEPDNAKQIFEKLLSRFPTTQHEAETLYFLTLLSENPEASPYRSTLLAKFPNSTYSRQLLRGKVNITSDTEAQANLAYTQVFNLYSAGDYDSALKQAEEGLLKYTGTSIEDKFAMLRILLLAKKDQKEQYTQALKEFTQSYPNSTLSKRAKEMLAIIQKK